MSVRASDWAWRQSVRGAARGNRLLVLLALADRADESGGNCFPGQKTLAGKCGISERAVRRHLAELEAGGLIKRERRRRDNGTRTSDGYTLTLPADLAGNQPANLAEPTGQIRPDLPAKSAGVLNDQRKRSGEPGRLPAKSSKVVSLAERSRPNYDEAAGLE